MSLPITAVGPLKVETKPILMLSAPSAGCASASIVAPASQNAFFIFTPLLIILMFGQPDGGRSGPRLRQNPFLPRLFCARNLSATASTNRKPRLEPSAHTQAACTIVRKTRGWQEL